MCPSYDSASGIFIPAMGNELLNFVVAAKINLQHFTQIFIQNRTSWEFVVSGISISIWR
jgi:hypothetical protein